MQIFKKGRSSTWSSLRRRASQTHFSVDEIKLSKLVVNPDVFAIDMDIDGTVTKCIIQDVQFHPVTDPYRTHRPSKGYQMVSL